MADTSVAAELPARRRAPRAPLLFLGLVVVPTLAAGIYFLFIAAPIYVSEAKFIVRSPSEPPTVGVSSMLQSVGIARSDTDAYAVHEFIMSREAVAQVSRRQDVRAMLGRPKNDPFERFPRPFEAPTAEHLYRAYKRFVGVGYDATTGISTLQVKAFSPQEAQAVARALLDSAEVMVNALNAQAERDAVEQARARVSEAQSHLAGAQQALTVFRNKERLIDPSGDSKGGLELVNKLSGELAVLRAERAGLAATAPQSPQLAPLDDRIRAYERQVSAERSKLAGESSSLAPKISAYERLAVEREFAQRELSSAVAAMDTARVEAARKRLYLQRVVNPGLADSAEYPKRWRNLMLVFLSALVAYGTLVLVLAGLREHRQ